MNDGELIHLVYDNVYGWIGNLMRDLAAQGVNLEPTHVAVALEMVSDELSAPDVEPEDFDDFLRNLTEGGDQ